MKFVLIVFSLLYFVFVFSACGGGNLLQKQHAVAQSSAKTEWASGLQIDASHKTDLADEDGYASILQSLDEIAELERAGSWMQGMAITESTLRENAGDYAGAVVAAYKEMSFAYGKGLIQKQDVEQGLKSLLELKDGPVNNDPGAEKTVSMTANAILAFLRGQWAQASDGLSLLFQEEEPDSFANWMILSCALEANPQDRRAAAAYKSIRARYAHFPEYWYHGARAFSGTIAAEFAEQCINSSPQGPFASECRQILASHTGLKNEEGVALKTKREIEALISQSVNSGDPKVLTELFPLIGLPDNPYTIYAVGALRSLVSVPRFKEYLSSQALSSRGRLAERLAYICRG